MGLENIDKSVELAKSYLEERKTSLLEKQEASKTEEQKKQEAEAKTKEAEDQKKREQAEELVLDKEENELNDEEKKIREEALKKRELEPEQQKILRGLKDANKRIDKLTKRNYEIKNELEAKLAEKEAEIEKLRQGLEKSKEPEQRRTIEQELSKRQTDRIDQYLREDASKDRNDRREMTDEELEEWLVEEPLKAHEWMIDRKERRKFEYEQDVKNMQNKTVEEQTQMSLDRFIKAYPNVMPVNRIDELKREGKSPEEIEEVLSKEYIEFRLADEIMKSNPQWGRRKDFGDLMIAEMKKRLAEKPKDKEQKKVFTEEEVNRIVEEKMKSEMERRERADYGVGSVNRGSTGSYTPEEEQLRSIAEKGGLDPEKVLARHKYRQLNKGSMVAPPRK